MKGHQMNHWKFSIRQWWTITIISIVIQNFYIKIYFWLTLHIFSSYYCSHYIQSIFFNHFHLVTSQALSTSSGRKNLLLSRICYKKEENEMQQQKWERDTGPSSIATEWSTKHFQNQLSLHLLHHLEYSTICLLSHYQLIISNSSSLRKL